MSCTGVLSLHQLVIDGSDRALGGIRADRVQLGEIDSCLVVGFVRFGINLDGSGGMLVHDCWIGQYSLFDQRLLNVTATCLYMNGSGVEVEHDSVVRDVIIFSGLIGIDTHNSGNLITGVHVWNLAGARGGIGMLVSPGVRITDCYFDYTPLVLVDPSGLIVADSFFYGTSNIVIQSPSPNPSITELQITGNWFDASNKTIIVQGPYPIASVFESVIENNVAVQKIDKASTRATMSCLTTKESSCTMDFSTVLVFPAAAITEARCFLQSPEPIAFTTQIDHQSVIVTADTAFTGVFLCDVDQSTRWHPAH
jgi:hypothetical protein